VSGVIDIGKTASHAGSDGGTANADGLDLLGEQLDGGSQKGVGSNNGSILTLPDNPLLVLEVAPWEAKVANAGGGTQSHAEAALLHVNLDPAGSILEVWVLHSQSDSTWTPESSTGDSQSDGAEVNLLNGTLDVKVLHSEAHSTGKSESDILVLNGDPVLGSPVGNGCDVDLDPVLKLLCLQASGGTAGDITSSGAEAAQATSSELGLTGDVVGASSQGGKLGTPTAPKLPKPKKAKQVTQGAKKATGLPFTGTDADRMGAIAVALTAIGGTLTTMGRRRRTARGAALV
jgi:hypothetical protein